MPRTKHSPSSPVLLTDLKFGEVGGGEGLVQVLGDVLPGGQPLVPVLLPGLVVLLPGSRRKCALHLKIVFITFSFLAFSAFSTFSAGQIYQNQQT